MKAVLFVHVLVIVCLGLFLRGGQTQNCLNAAGEPVSWWVVLKVPPVINNNGYGYYDSNTKSGQFIFVNKTIDLQTSALTQTFGQINRDKLERVAWNDEKPDNQTSSSLAHSKGLIAYNKAAGRGFYIVHSIPKYPAFFADHTINMTIGKSQLIYGQHIACFSLSLYELNNIAFNLQGIRPFVYETMFTTSAVNQYIIDLAQGVVKNIPDSFRYYDMRPTNYTLRAIFKTNVLNASIFEDGLVKWLNAGKLTAETWGRPLQGAWCSQALEVDNVKQVTLTPAIKWTESNDHSKWVLAESKYSCFGDMNRMPSQWKRGGAFFCLEDLTLHAALKKVITASDSCSKVNIMEKLFNLKSE